MKKLTLILCVVVAMAFVSMVFAQTATPPQKQTPAQQPKYGEKGEKQVPAQPAKPPAPKEPIRKPTEQKKMTEKITVGMVVSVDAVANTFVVKGKKTDMTFQVAPMAKIMIAGKEAKLADIKKDSKVIVNYKWEGKTRVATSIKCS